MYSFFSFFSVFFPPRSERFGRRRFQLRFWKNDMSSWFSLDESEVRTTRDVQRLFYFYIIQQTATEIAKYRKRESITENCTILLFYRRAFTAIIIAKLEYRYKYHTQRSIFVCSLPFLENARFRRNWAKWQRCQQQGIENKR